MRISDWSSDVCSSDLAFSAEQPIKQGRNGKANIVKHPPEHTAIMTWVKRHSCHLHPIYPLTLQPPKLISRIDLTAWIVWKASDHLYLKALMDQFTSKNQAFRSRLWIKPLCQQEHTNCHMAQYSFQTRSEEHPSELQSLMRI